MGSYANPGGTGNRVAYISVAVAGVAVTGNPTVLLNGVVDSTLFFNGGQAVAGGTITFAFTNAGAGLQTAVIDEAKWYQDTTASHGVWKWQGSTDGTAWTDIGASFTLGGATPFQTQSTLHGNTTAYAYYRILGISGTDSSGPWLQEIEFSISGFSAPVPSDPTLAGVLYMGGIVPGVGSVVPAAYDGSLPGGVIGVAYSQTFSAVGGVAPYAYSLASGSSLPASLSLSSAGTVSGTPSAVGSSTFSIQITDNNGVIGTQSFTLAISAPSSSSGANYGFVS